NRLPLRRPVRRAGNGAAERDEQARPASVATLVFVRPRVAGARAQGLGRQGGERRSSATRLLPSREDEQRGAYRHVRTGDGTGSGYGVSEPQPLTSTP